MTNHGAEGRLRLELYGRVQGVGFRMFTVRTARELGIRGWVKNRPDGSVDIHAEGSPGALERFRERVRKGPSVARVESVKESDAVKGVPEDGFEVRY